MKTLIALLALLLIAAPASKGADASGRVDTRVLAGMKANVQDEFTSIMTPVFVRASLLYLVTNKSDGLIICRTNLDTKVVIGLPNPTNNLSRRFEISSGAANVVVTNYTYVTTFTELTTDVIGTTGYAVASNKVAILYSTGTNYIAYTK